MNFKKNDSQHCIIKSKTMKKETSKTKKIKPKPINSGLKITRYFTEQNVSPFDQFTYENRSSIIRNTDGEAVFEMHNVEVPVGWSQVATDILAQKYFRKTGVPQNDGSSGGENSIKQVAHRMEKCWAEWGKANNYFSDDKGAQVFL